MTTGRLLYLQKKLLPGCLDALSVRHTIKLRPGDLWSQLLEADPAPNHKHLQWIMRQVIQGHLVPEDFGTIRAVLEDFIRLKQKLIDAGGSPDINQHPNYRDLGATLSTFAGEEEINQSDSDLARAQSKMWAENSDLIVVEPLTEFASNYWGRGTRWCTAATVSKNYFSSYSAPGRPLSIFIFRDQGLKYQLGRSGSTYQPILCDAADRYIKWSDLPKTALEVLLESSGGMACAAATSPTFWESLNLPERSPEQIKAAVRGSWTALQYIPSAMITEELALIAVEQNGLAIQSIPEAARTETVVMTAIQQNRFAAAFLRQAPSEPSMTQA